MSDVDIRKCDGPSCDYQVEKDAPRTLSQVDYHEFHELYLPRGTVKHFHTMGCLRRWVNDPLRKGNEQ